MIYFLLANSCTFVVDAQLGQLDPELAKRLYGEALVSLVSKKNTPMHLSFFSEAFRRYPALGALMIEPAVSACQLASKPYAHTQAFALLECLAKLPVCVSLGGHEC